MSKKTLPVQEDPTFPGSPPGCPNPLRTLPPLNSPVPITSSTVSHQIVFMTFMLISSLQLNDELLAGGVCTVCLSVFRRLYGDEHTAGCSGRLMGQSVFSPTLMGPPLHLFLICSKYAGWTRVLSVSNRQPQGHLDQMAEAGVGEGGGDGH